MLENFHLRWKRNKGPSNGVEQFARQTRHYHSCKEAFQTFLDDDRCKNLFPWLQYNALFDTAISMDGSGMLNYWGGQKESYSFPKCVQFDSLLDTDLYEFAKVLTLREASSLKLAT